MYAGNKLENDFGWRGLRAALPARLGERTWYHLGRLAVAAASPLLFDLDIRYHCPLPTGARLLCANHPSTIDPVLLTGLFPEQVSILISETLFKVPGLGPALALGGHIRVAAGQGRAALAAGQRLLSEGRSVAIFPEGAISPAAGGLARLHSGAARMAIASGAPVIPLGIALRQENLLRIPTVVDGRAEVATFYLRGPYAVTVGTPLYFAGNAQDRVLVGAATAQIAAHMAALAAESAQRLAERNSAQNALPTGRLRLARALRGGGTAQSGGVVKF